MKPQIRVLGGYALFDASGVALDLPTRKSWALLAYLAQSDGRDISRESLGALLWPLSNERQARASLRQELAVLRKTMSRAGLPGIDSTKEKVRIHLPVNLVDAGAMANLIKTGSNEALREAVAYYRGEFLAGLNVSAHPFEDWLWVERQRLKALAQDACLLLLELDTESQDTDRTMATAMALLAIEPTQEHAHRALMRIYRRAGRRAEALQQFQRCAESLRRELDTGPSQDTVALAISIRADSAGPRAVAHNAPFIRRLRPVPVRPERHMVDVLVARLTGVSQLGHDDDPSRQAVAQDQFTERCARIITEHGGAVLFGPGDRVVGCFGYPGSGEQDHELAVRAAQAIAAKPVSLAEGSALWPGLGIASGVVLIRPNPHDPLQADLVGSCLQRAATFAHTAQAGEVVVGAEIGSHPGTSPGQPPRTAASPETDLSAEPGVLIQAP